MLFLSIFILFPLHTLLGTLEQKLAMFYTLKFSVTFDDTSFLCDLDITFTEINLFK